MHTFAQWTTTVPPEELIGPWDQGVSITDGPGGHLRRNVTAYNTHKSQLVIMNSIDTSLCCHINDYVYIQLTYTRTLSIAHAFMYDHIYIHIYQEVYPIYFIVGVECVRGITHFALVLPFCTCITHFHLHYPLFALALPICTCITHLHFNYSLFAIELPICTCIALLHLYHSFALALPIICTCITHYLHLHYPFALVLPIICTGITHLHLHYPFAIVFALPITLQL